MGYNNLHTNLNFNIIHARFQMPRIKSPFIDIDEMIALSPCLFLQAEAG